MTETAEQTVAKMAATIYDGVKLRNMDGLVTQNAAMAVSIAREIIKQVRATKPARAR